MSQDLPRFFVERIAAIEPDPSSGNVKLTYAIRSKNSNHDVVQLVMHVNDLRRSFGEVFEVMQKVFFDAKPGAKPGAKPAENLTDITGS
ncbi:MAG TPA: hypothetical protein VKN35_03910 [Xanthomonadales bacterium]|nr:hypothetical protein [Xanthomonadales bacterium]